MGTVEKVTDSEKISTDIKPIISRNINTNDVILSYFFSKASFIIYLNNRFRFNFALAYALIQNQQKTNKSKQKHILYFQNTLILLNEIINNKSSFSSGGSIFNFFSF